MQSMFHIAIIPDGNRRWAKQNGITAYAKLYDKGVERTLDAAELAFARGATHLSLWGSSYANLSARDGDFAKQIDLLYRDNIKRFSTHDIVDRYDIRIEAAGEWRSMLTDKTIAVIEDAIEQTKHRHGRVLTFLIGYSGDRERGAALEQLMTSPPETLPREISTWKDLLHEYSWTKNLPPVDLIVRTGAWDDPHNSAGFLSLIADEAQLTFPKVLWPDFDQDVFSSLLDDFEHRERRRGK